MKTALTMGIAVGTLMTAPVFGATAYKLRVAGLNDPHCAYSVEKSVKAAQGMHIAHMDLAKDTLTVKVSDGGPQVPGNLRGLIDHHGCKVRKIRRRSG